MVEPISISAILISNVSRYVAGYLDERAKSAANAGVRRDERDFQRRQQADQYTHELDLARRQEHAAVDQARLAADLDLKRLLDQRKLDLYPVQDGPGSLRRSLALVHPGQDAEEAPLLVLLCPMASEDALPSWSGLRQRVLDDLMQYQRRDLIRTRLLDRAFQWPHDELYRNDLYGIPALIVQILIARQRLGVHLGGCHLGRDRVREPQSMYSLRWPDASSWTGEAVDRLNSTAVAGRAFALRGPDTADDLLELNHELASRVITLCVVTAIDAYYLVNRWGYDEQLDQALNAAGVVSEDWPVDSGVPAELVRDSAYHLMFCSERRVSRGDWSGADSDLRAAFAAVSGSDTGVESAPADIVGQAIASGNLEEHHRAKALAVTAELPDDLAWREAREMLNRRPELPQTGFPAEGAAADADPPAQNVAVRRPASPAAARSRPPGPSTWSDKAQRDPLDGF